MLRIYKGLPIDRVISLLRLDVYGVIQAQVFSEVKKWKFGF